MIEWNRPAGPHIISRALALMLSQLITVLAIAVLPSAKRSLSVSSACSYTPSKIFSKLVLAILAK